MSEFGYKTDIILNEQSIINWMPLPRIMILRDYQSKAIADVRATYASGKRSICLVMPTGAGKTIVAVSIILAALARGRRVLFLAHRKELIDQTVDKLVTAGLDLQLLRVIRAQHGWGSPVAPVVVASVPTLAGASWDASKPPADLVILDEVHHVAAASFRRVVGCYPRAHFLGLTATPCRGDDRPLGDICDAIVLGPTVRQLTEAGHLVPCRVWSPNRELATGEIAQSPLDAYREQGNGGRTVIFCRDVAHAEGEAEIWGCPVVHGKTPDRGAILAAFARGEHQAIASVGVLTEGWDDPGCSVVILARSIGHVGLYLQICGRALRPAPGKTQATVIDLHGSHWNPAIGLPDADRNWKLDGKGAPPLYREEIRQCRKCGSVFRAADRCPYCGHLAPTPQAAIPRVTGDDLELASAAPKAPPRIWYENIESKYPGRCSACMTWFPIGTPIVWAKGYARHQECPPKEIRDAS